MNITEAPEIASTTAQDPVKFRYRPQACPRDGDGRNLDRVRLLTRLFGLSISEIAKAGGVSRPYLSRALGGSLQPSPAFFRRLEGNLGRLVEQRGSQFFSIPVTACEGNLAAGLGAEGQADGNAHHSPDCPMVNDIIYLVHRPPLSRG
jgi:transcriptional regulator with XRE-family HTH domain